MHENNLARLVLCLGIGFTTGLRSMTGPAVVAWAVHLGWLHPQGALAFVGRPWAVGLFTLLAIGEMIADKLPTTPDRTGAIGLSGRILAGDSAAQTGQTPVAAKTSAQKGAWTIGIYTGPSPLQLAPPANVKNPVLTAAAVNDLNVDTIAHPFMVVEGSRYYLFFTAKDLKTDKGGIGLAESTNGFDWKYRRAVIHESYVTSHPYVFKWRGDYYMIPEAHTETSVRLYKATRFPDEWKYERDLLTGDHFISATLAQFKNMWWMFTIRPGNETLRLFYADDFKGRWTEHPLSPVVAKDLRKLAPLENRVIRAAVGQPRPGGGGPDRRAVCQHGTHEAPRDPLMGRHAVPEPGHEPLEPAPTAALDLRSRLVLALTVGVTTLLATSWAGLPWAQAGIAAGGAAVLVPIAAWVAGTMPPRPTPYSDARDSDHQRK